jgi:hypothetical protein
VAVVANNMDDRIARIKDIVRRKTPAMLYGFLQTIKYKIFFSKFDKDRLILNSIPKSGTNYLRMLITNYLFSTHYNLSKRISYTDMHEKHFPNVREYLFSRTNPTRYIYPTANHPIRRTPYKDFVYGHAISYLNHSSASRIIHLYRNPFDFLVSKFYYSYKNRPERSNWYSHPRDLIDIELPDYIKQFKYMKDLAQKRTNVLRIPYELLIRNPFETLFIILNWANIDIDIQRINQAVEFSDKKYVHNEEYELGKAIHTPDGYKGSFVRSGKIGEWKEYFSNEDQRKIEIILREHKVNLSEFILD